jgi:nicotinamide riboside transporter PnuC
MYLFWEKGLNFSVFLFFGYALTAVYGFYQWKKELKDGETT